MTRRTPRIVLAALLMGGAATLPARPAAAQTDGPQADGPQADGPQTDVAPTAPAPDQRTARPPLRARFAAANTTHDGRLTLAQAEAAGMRNVARNFDTIDVGRKGYVTLADIHAFRRARRAAAAAGAPGAEPPP